MKRHKHADLIHAYAEGAEIQLRSTCGRWMDVTEPCFSRHGTYRIKPTAPLIDEETRKAIKHLFKDANWLAMDEDGGACLFNMKPIMDTDTWVEDDGDDRHERAPKYLDNYAPDFRTSLVDLNEEVR